MSYLSKHRLYRHNKTLIIYYNLLICRIPLCANNNTEKGRHTTLWVNLFIQYIMSVINHFQVKPSGFSVGAIFVYNIYFFFFFLRHIAVSPHGLTSFFKRATNEIWRLIKVIYTTIKQHMYAIYHWVGDTMYWVLVVCQGPWGVQGLVVGVWEMTKDWHF